MHMTHLVRFLNASDAFDNFPMLRGVSTLACCVVTKIVLLWTIVATKMSVDSSLPRVEEFNTSGVLLNASDESGAYYNASDLLHNFPILARVHTLSWCVATKLFLSNVDTYGALFNAYDASGAFFETSDAFW